MLGRLPTGAVVALLVGAGCYDVPTPDCGFACGPAAACPTDYTCSALDNRCHHVNAAPDLWCPAATPVDPGTVPYLLAASPAEGDTGTDVRVHPRFQFSEPVTGVSESSIQMFEDVTSVPVSLRVDYDGELNLAELVPFAPLLAGTGYRIVLGASITDFEGNPLIDAPFTLRFTTAIDVPPQVTFISPSNGETQVPVNTSVQVFFSEQMLGLATGLELRDASNNVVPAALSVELGIDGISLFPSALLTPGATYTASLATTLTDTTGNPVVGAPVAWSFTTFIDSTPPSFFASSPMPDEMNVVGPPDIRIAMDEEIINADESSVLVSTGGAPISGVVTTGFNGAQIIFTPAVPLPAGATIDVTLTTAITDRAGNALFSPITFSFTTAP